MADCILQMNSITKTFGGIVKVPENVSFSVSHYVLKYTKFGHRNNMTLWSCYFLIAKVIRMKCRAFYSCTLPYSISLTEVPC